VARARAAKRNSQPSVALAPRTRASVARPAEHPHEGSARRQDPDVLLDVPSLKVDEITLEVQGLQARVALEARGLDLLRLDVGADVSLALVDLGIRGVEARRG
jgi:hypothetical protein